MANRKKRCRHKYEYLQMTVRATKRSQNEIVASEERCVKCGTIRKMRNVGED